MKNFIFAVIFAAMALCLNSCYKSVETDLGDGLTSFTAKVEKQEYVGLRDQTGYVLLEPCYNEIYYQNGLIVASKDDCWHIFTPDGKVMFENYRFEKFSYGSGYFIFETAREKYFYVPDGALSGPASKFTYYPSKDLLIVENNGAYGLTQALSGKELMKPQYIQIVIACDKNENLGYYGFRGKAWRRVVDGKEKILTSSQVAALKKDATSNKASWPKANGFVRVASLR